MQCNRELVEHLIRRGGLKTPRIIDAFRQIDRIHFIPSHAIPKTYIDAPLSIGHGQTISQPYTVAFMLELLQPRQGCRILDVGAGSGWTTALLAQIVGLNGHVLGLERVPELLAFGRNNLARFDFPQAEIQMAGELLGLPDQSFDCILVSAAARAIPSELVQQLEIGGRMVIPVQSSIFQVDRTSDKHWQETEHIGFSFVPLIY